MGLSQVLLKGVLGLLLAFPSFALAWDEETLENGFLMDQGTMDFPQESLPSEVLMRLRGRRMESPVPEPEVPTGDWVKPQVVFPVSYISSLYGGRRLYPMDWASNRLDALTGLKKKRYSK
jgi:hypothetical protein